VYDWLSYDVVRFKIEVGVEEKFVYKNVTQHAPQYGHCHSSSKLWPAAILAAAQSIPAGCHKIQSPVCRVSRNKNCPFESFPWANYVTKRGDVIFSTEERCALLKLL